ncbi:MAG: alpha-amylase, partial [Eudoraea sp.]|nr:alpha-amylase [Eudoraea sp.]NNK31387.1 alpha-amylase [Flavobacteriaceae bacterium]
ELRDFYKRLLNFTLKSEALMGEYEEIHFFNKEHTDGYDHRVLTYLRWSDNEKLIIISNFDSGRSYDIELKLPGHIIKHWELEEGNYALVDALYGTQNSMQIKGGIGHIPIRLDPLQSYIFRLEE